MPISGTLALVTQNVPEKMTRASMYQQMVEVKDAAILACLSAWRTTQGIYRFHPKLSDAVAKTPLDWDLPVELFFRPPEWCIFVLAGGLTWMGKSIYGFFAHMEYDVNTGRRELRFLFEIEGELVPVALHVDQKTIIEAVEGFQKESLRNFERFAEVKTSYPGLQTEQIINDVTPMVSLLLYLCAVNAEIVDPTNSDRNPQKPQAKKTKKGERIFPAPHPVTWEVGYRLGAALGQQIHSQSEANPQGGTHASPRPHLRRAHWHSFWTGHRKIPGNQKLVVKWMSPIFIGAEKNTSRSCRFSTLYFEVIHPANITLWRDNEQKSRKRKIYRNQ